MIDTIQKLGFEMIHFGINTDSPECATNAAEKFSVFGMVERRGKSSTFMNSSIEIMHSQFYGTHGHIGFKCNSIEEALVYLKDKGFTPKMESAKYNEDGNLSVIYLNEEIEGFAIHLVRR